MKKSFDITALCPNIQIIRREKVFYIYIGNVQLGDVDDTTINTFGDAYEYLMTMYASQAGKSGYEFFTP